MKHNYHAHTPWSHHASISAEESVLKAISLGFKTWGFSEHSLQENSTADFRLVTWKELDGFVKETVYLQNKYKDKIDIKIGLEFDYRHDDTGEKQINFLKRVLEKYPAIKYVLYAPHFYGIWRHAFEIYPTKKEMDNYLKDLRNALKEFNFTYIVHPDGFCKGMQSWTKDAEYLAHEISKIAVEFNIPLGLNSNGLGYEIDFCYPRIEFWKIAASYGVKAILELDSHSDRSISQERINYIKKIAKDSKIELIHKLDI